jgi:hypothetical protein
MKTVRSYLPLLLLAAGFALVMAFAWQANSSTVAGQCSKPSSCLTCHETQGLLPVKSSGAWHEQHAIYDFCADCHGGGKLSADAGIAHNGVNLDLNGMQAACATCHTDNYTSLLAGYAGTLGVSIDPNYKPPPAAAADPIGGFLGSGQALVSVPETAVEPAAVPAASKSGNIILSGLILLVGSGGGGYIYWNEGRKRRSQQGAAEISLETEKTSEAALEKLLARLSPDGRDALEILLEDEQQGEETLIQLAMLDPEKVKKLIVKARKEEAEG